MKHEDIKVKIWKKKTLTILCGLSRDKNQDNDVYSITLKTQNPLINVLYTKIKLISK